MTAPSGTRLLELTASRPDEVVCTDDEGRRRTRAELLDRATRLGRLLHARGAGPGDHIAVCTDNRVEYIETYLAAVLSGVWFVPVNPLLTPAEVAHILADSGARLVLADEPHRDLVTEATGAAVPVVTYGGELDGLLEKADPTPFRPGDPAGSRFSYTSGTTGRPKGVKRAIPPTVGTMLDLQARLGHQVGCDGRGTHLVTGPAHHAAPGGYAFFDLCAGARLHLMRRFDAARTLDLLESLDVTHVHLVPTMMVRLLRLPESRRRAFRAPALELVLHGAAPIAPSVKTAMIDWWGPVLVEYWGTSEAGTFTRVDSVEWLERPGTVGRPVEGFEVVAVDPDEPDRILPPGEMGLLVCHTPGRDRPFAYWNDPDKTAATYLGPGRFALGDMGRVDADGYVYLADRATNMIISGGVNVYPAEVTAVLVEHPGVVDAAVFGVPDEEWGEQVRAAVELTSDADPDAVIAELHELCTRRLSRYKRPRTIEVHPALPRQPNGKLYVRALRDPHWAGRERAI